MVQNEQRSTKGLSLKLLEGNYDPKVHGLLKHGHDAFGNPVVPEEGYRMLDRTELIQIGDRHFDIYNGWQTGGEGYHAKNKHHAHSDGRWRCWSRKIVTEQTQPVSVTEEQSK